MQIPSDFFDSRDKFQRRIHELGWESTSFPIKSSGPGGERLTIDVGIRRVSETAPTIFVTSGCHGAEGFFGAATQLTWLANVDRRDDLERLNLVFLHALNPFGYAWLRRWNEDGVDLNRNFLNGTEPYEGSHPAYARLDKWLNPRKPISAFDPFYPRAVWEILRIGFKNAAAAVAAGQYDFPRGLFYGGDSLSESGGIVEKHFRDWIPAESPVMHFDLHTGLGPWGDCQLLEDRPVDPSDKAWLSETFAEASLDWAADDEFTYVARGGFGNWCAEQHSQADYYFLCVEVGTYSALRVLRALRAENAEAQAGLTSAARQKHGLSLKEIFFPKDSDWRTNAIGDAIANINRGVKAMRKRYGDSH